MLVFALSAEDKSWRTNQRWTNLALYLADIIPLCLNPTCVAKMLISVQISSDPWVGKLLQRPFGIVMSYLYSSDSLGI